MFDGPRVSTGENVVSRKQLFTRAANGNLAALERYLVNSGNIDAKDDDGLALIHHAACHGDVPLIRRLCKHGADMNLLDNGTPPWKPIHYAIFHRKQETEQVLRTLGGEAPIPLLKRIALEKPRGLWDEKEITFLFGRT